MNRTAFWTAAIGVLAASAALAEDWSPRLAAEYLDDRQKEWFAWAPAKAFGGPCVSCHTGLTYLLARPALRKALGERDPTVYETGLIEAARARVTGNPADVFKAKKEPYASQAMGVEAVLAALVLNIGKPATDSTTAARALDRLWSLQVRDGTAKGSWAWFELNLDPYEMPESTFFGASLAALAVGSSPRDYRERPNVKMRIGELGGYLANHQTQPLHNRLILLWASTRLPQALDAQSRKSIIQQTLTRQQADGSWTAAALGPWTEHPNAPAAEGADTYATAVTAFALRQAGVPGSNPNMARALAWLRSHQDRTAGYWPAVSMNKRFEPGSMQSKFMQDAATSFAVLALLE